MMFKKILWGLVFLLLISFVSANLVITEVMYDPATSQADDSDLEWIEIFNSGVEDVDLSLWTINGYAFDDMTIPAGEYLVLAKQLIDDGDADLDSFESFYGNNDGVWNSSDGNYNVTDYVSLNLAQGGMLINLSNGTEKILFDYTPYAGLANGNGKTLELSTAGTWGASFFDGGTPGAENTLMDSVKPIISLAVNSTTITEYDIVAFNFTNSTDNIGIKNYSIDFGDGKVINGTSTSSGSGDGSSGGHHTITDGLYAEHRYMHNGSYTYSLTITDLNGNSNTTQGIITVTDIDPVADFTSTTPVEDQQINFTDISASYDGITAYEWNVNGTIYTSQNATHTFTVDGTYDVTLKVTEVDGDTDTETKQIVVAFVNDAPVYTGLADITLAEDSQIVVDVGNATDEEGVLTYVCTTLNPNVTLTHNVTNTKILNITAGNNWFGDAAINCTATDLGGLQVKDSFTLTVTSVNDAPTLDAKDITVDEDESLLVDLKTIMDDVEDGDNLTVLVEYDTAILHIDLNQTAKSINISSVQANWNDTTWLNITVTDTDGAFVESNYSVKFNEINDAPEIQDITQVTATETKLYTAQATATDVENEQITFAPATVPAGFNINASGYITWTPTAAQAGIVHEITIRATDARGLTDDYAYNVTVLPVLDIINVKVNGVAVDGVVNVTPGEALTVTYDIINRFATSRLAGVDSNGTLLGVVREEAQFAFNAGSIHSVTFNYQLPFTGLSDTFSLELEVSGHNNTNGVFSSTETVDFAVQRDVHNILIDGSALGPSELTCSKTTELNVNLSNIGDFGETDVMVRVYTDDQSVNITQGPYSINSNDELPLTIPINAENVTANTQIHIEVKYFWNDYTATEAVLLQIGDCFDKAAVELALRIAEDFPSAKSINLTDYTNNNTVVTYTATMDNKTLIDCDATADGVFICQKPAANMTGDALVNLTITAGTTVNLESFYVTVVGENDAPRWTQSIIISAVDEDSGTNTATELSQYAADTETASNALTYTATSANASEILCTIFNNTYLSFTPAANWSGTGYCNVTVSDGIAQVSQQLTIIVNPVNDVPQINAIADQTAVIGEAFGLQVTAADVEDTQLTYELTAAPSGMTINDTGYISWTPNATGSYDVTVRVNDSEGSAVSDSFSVEVTEGLLIENVMIIVDDGTPQAVTGNVQVVPSQSIDLTFKVANSFSGITIENVFINASNTALGLFDDEDVDSIAPNSDENINLITGTVSALAVDGTYDLLIQVSGTDDNDNDYYASSTVTLEVDRNNHQLSISQASISPATVSCSRFADVSVTVVNSGLVDENVTIKVANTALGIDVDSDYYMVSDSHTFTIPVNASLLKAAGSYTLTITADSDDATASSSVSWTVQACSITYSPLRDPVITENVNQAFGVALPTGFPFGSIRWYYDGNLQTADNDQTTYTYEAENLDGIQAHNINVVVNDSYDYTASHSWVVTASSRPITTGFNGATTVFSGMNETELANVTNATFEISNYGKIVFNEPLDLTDVVNIPGTINIVDGIVAVDKTTYPQFDNVPATITLYGLDYDETPKIYFSGAFTTQASDITTECAFCTLLNYTAAPTTNGLVVFRVDHFSSFRVDDEATPVVPPVDNNTAPTITSSADTSATVDQKYQYQVVATDAQTTSLTYSLTTKPANMTITTAGLIEWTPTAVGSYSVVVSVSDGEKSTTQSYTLTVSGENYLIIDSVKVTVNDDKQKSYSNGKEIRNIKPGSTLEFEVKAKNDYDNSTDIDDIEFTVTIEDVDDGSDIDDTYTYSDKISRGKKATANLIIELPYQIDEDETYNVVIEVDGEDEYGVNQGEIWDLTLTIDKDDDDIAIKTADVSPSILSCTRSASLDVELVNIGKDEQDVTLTVQSAELDIDEEVEVTLDERWDDSDNDYSKTFYFTVDSDVPAGDYDIEVKARYSGKSTVVQVPIMVQDCVKATVNEAEDDLVELQAFTYGIAPTTSTATKTDTISFKDSDMYTALLLCGIIIALGLIVFMVGAVIITSKKK